jgi:UDP-glucose 4-epimerase
VRNFVPGRVNKLAAVHHIPTCETKHAYPLDVNVGEHRKKTLEIATATGPRRFFLSSSGAIYDRKDGAFDEGETALHLADNYSRAKYGTETQAILWADCRDGQVVIARIFNTIGHDDPNAHLIPDVVLQIKSGKGGRGDCSAISRHPAIVRNARAFSTRAQTS